MRIYLDNCCFNRPFDDQASVTIRLETEAKLVIQNKIRSGGLELVWSFILSLENEENPFEEKKESIIEWRQLSNYNIQADDFIRKKASSYERIGISSKDALHLACAVYGKVEYFLTTDRKLIKYGENIGNICVMNPVDFVAVLEEKYEN